MSSASSTLPGRRPVLARPRARSAGRTLPPAVRLIAFGALALYGAVRWGTLMTSPPTGRLLALVLVAFALAALGPLLAARAPALAVLLAIVTAVAMLAVAGLPASWIRHLRFAVAARHISQGLAALPHLLVPYRGANQWVRTVMLLGAAVLLFDGAVMMAFAMRAGDVQPGGEPSRSGDLRRAVAALPLIALAAVPLTLVPARFQYFQGAVIFALLAALIWGERLPRHGSGTATVVCGVAAALAMALAPAIDAHKPWIQYQTVNGGAPVGFGETFNWSQLYGPINWPRSGREVLEVSATRGDYWKAINLGEVTASGWAQGPPDASTPPPPTQADANRYSQQVTVTIEELRTSDIIGPGDLQAPASTTQAWEPGNSPGRWLSVVPLGYGDSYTARAYSPDPTDSELESAGTQYSSSIIPNYLQVEVRAGGQVFTAFVDQYGEPGHVLVHTDAGPAVGAGLLMSSPAYRRAYLLAMRLRSHARTPIDYVRSVLAYLRQPKFRYDEHPPVSRYPLDSFLFDTHRGYCQQFAGAMALLLRLGGVPARVGAGFTKGTYNTSLHRWVVTDFDAHAWVEAYFPGYGWVRFEPTPASSDPAQQPNNTPLSPAGGDISGGVSALANAKPRNPLLGLRGDRAAAAARAHHGAPLGLLIPGGLLAVLALVAIGSLLRHMLLTSDAHSLVEELERAFTRTGRPLVPQFTLAQLEHRMDGIPQAQAYVRTLAGARYAGAPALPSAAERRALRRYLRAGLGMTGAVRAWWALPPLLSQRSWPIKRVRGQ
jgi:transglutaminase superfamily protein